MDITRSYVTQVQEEISRAVRQHIDNIDGDCSDQIFIYKVTRSSVNWTMRCLQSMWAPQPGTRRSLGTRMYTRTHKPRSEGGVH